MLNVNMYAEGERVELAVVIRALGTHLCLVDWDVQQKYGPDITSRCALPILVVGAEAHENDLRILGQQYHIEGTVEYGYHEAGITWIRVALDEGEAAPRITVPAAYLSYATPSVD